MWSALAKKHPDKFSAKSLTTMSKMAELIQAYPLGDALDERLSEKLQVQRVARSRADDGWLNVSAYS